MVMNNGMIPVPGGHGGSQISSMVPVGGMQQGNHLNQPMQGGDLVALRAGRLSTKLAIGSRGVDHEKNLICWLL